MRIKLLDTPENEALVREVLRGYFEFADKVAAEQAQSPLAAISRGDGIEVEANEGEYPHHEIQCLYRDLVFSSLPPDSWEVKYPEYIGTWNERGLIQ